MQRVEGVYSKCGIIEGRSRDVVERLSRRGVVILCCLQEVRYRGEGISSIRADKDKYK